MEMQKGQLVYKFSKRWSHYVVYEALCRVPPGEDPNTSIEDSIWGTTSARWRKVAELQHVFSPFSGYAPKGAVVAVVERTRNSSSSQEVSYRANADAAVRPSSTATYYGSNWKLRPLWTKIEKQEADLNQSIQATLLRLPL